MTKNKVRLSSYSTVCAFHCCVLPAIDCLLAEDWQPWSECDTRCGYGVQVRVKDVLVQPQNGGRECDETVERRLCEGTHCKLPRSHRGTVSQLKGPNIDHYCN